MQQNNPARFAKQDTLYYDGQCPLCSKEITQLKKKQRGGLAFQDIHQINESAQAAQNTAASLPNKNTLLQTLHLHTANGQWLLGPAATVAAWQHTHWGWLFRPLNWAVLAPVVNKVYTYWAKKRYQRLYGCQSDCRVNIKQGRKPH